MDNLINTFYIGNTNRFGFGTYNASSNNYKGILAVGINSNYFIFDSFSINGSLTYCRIVNSLYNQDIKLYPKLHNIMCSLELKYSF